MNGRVVAVLGISGVGKTTMVAAFIRCHPWVHNIRASTLLSETTAIEDTEALRTASEADIHANQDRLALAFSGLRNLHPDRHIIFDGHSLIDNGERLIVVPITTFVKLSPNIIVFLEDSAAAIQARRLSDAGRTRPRRSVHEILLHQQAAKEAALSYSTALAVPCVIIKSGDSATFEMVLKREFHGKI